MIRSLRDLRQDGDDQEKRFVELLVRPYRSEEDGDDGWWKASSYWNKVVGAYYSSDRGLTHRGAELEARLAILVILVGAHWATPQEAKGAGG